MWPACQRHQRVEAPSGRIPLSPPTCEELALPICGDLGTRSSCLRAVAQTRGPTIYLGPLVREGFADIATGIRDSIRDIRHEVRAAVFSDVNATAHAAVPLKA